MNFGFDNSKACKSSPVNEEVLLLIQRIMESIKCSLSYQILILQPLVNLIRNTLI